MKKIARKIAMILVIIMLVSSFTSCFTMWAIDNKIPELVLFTIVLDAVTLPIQIIVWFVKELGFIDTNELDSQIYLANVENKHLADYYSLRNKIFSLPEEELSSLKRILNAIPEIERQYTTEKIYSLQEEKIFSLISIYNTLPEREIISSIRRINSLSEKERISLLHSFNSLSEEKFDAIIESLKSLSENKNIALTDKSLPETEYTASVDYFEEKTHVELCFQY
jgi:hypothetical protein